MSYFMRHAIHKRFKCNLHFIVTCTCEYCKHAEGEERFLGNTWTYYGVADEEPKYMLSIEKGSIQDCAEVGYDVITSPLLWFTKGLTLQSG